LKAIVCHADVSPNELLMVGAYGEVTPLWGRRYWRRRTVWTRHECTRWVAIRSWKRALGRP